MLWPETTVRNNLGQIAIGGCALPELAERFGTPLYVFDEVTLRARARRTVTAMRKAYEHSSVLYAGKAYLSPAIVRILNSEGLGLDVVSSGELYGGLLAGVPAAQITFHGNNKGRDELLAAVDAGVGAIAIDNDLEIELLESVAKQVGTRVRVLLRLNPGIDVHTHEKIKTGAIDSKFGFPLWNGAAEAACERVSRLQCFDLAGYHVHLGSQLFEPDVSRMAVEMLMEFAVRMQQRYGVEARVISPGGGFGIAYGVNDEESVFEEWAQVTGTAVKDAATRLGVHLPELTVEPGRYIVGPSAVSLYTVGAQKIIPGVRHYVSVDGGMADNVRPSMYGAKYTAEIANRHADGPTELVSIAGKYCESGDILIKDVQLPEMHPGDLLAMPSAGAYALPMASNYNASTRPAVVLVNDGTAVLIRRRETHEDVYRTEIIPESVKPS